MSVHRARNKDLLLTAFAVSVVLVCCGGQVQAQGFGIERYIGPILPTGGLFATFRSEVGIAYSTATLLGAKLTGSRYGENDLRTAAFLEEGPSKYDIHADLRLWRLAARGAYGYFDTRSRHVNLGGFDFTGLRVGGSLDVVQLQWLTLGASGDFYFIDPRYRGSFFTNPTGQPAPPTPVSIDMTGARPATWGLCLRYMPPEIIGIPLHLEAYCNLPLTGSRLISYGGLLAFRPQIYRFDLAAKIGVERTHLKFSQTRENILPSQNWEIDMEWDMYRIEVAAYF